MQQQILVIDNSKTIHPLVKVILSEEPVEVHSAMDAKYGMVLAASIRPDLILLDVDMPGMDGFEACKQLKADPATANVPIIFLTSHSTVAEKVRGLGLGAIDYVTKPFNRAELMARVRTSLRTNQSIRLLEEKATIDALTGLGNRAMFDQRLEAEVCLHVRTKHPLSCILMDVDRFKRINDTFGHPFGDKVLKRIAEIITDLCRTEDVACRYGGEEFAIWRPTPTPLPRRFSPNVSRANIPREVRAGPQPEHHARHRHHRHGELRDRRIDRYLRSLDGPACRRCAVSVQAGRPRPRVHCGARRGSQGNGGMNGICNVRNIRTRSGTQS